MYVTEQLPSSTYDLDQDEDDPDGNDSLRFPAAEARKKRNTGNAYLDKVFHRNKSNTDNNRNALSLHQSDLVQKYYKRKKEKKATAAQEMQEP